MHEIRFQPDDNLYRDRDTLFEDYTPEAIVGRDDELMDGVADLAEHQQLTLYALATFEGAGETPVSSQTIYDRYSELCRHIGNDPLTSCRVRDFLKEMADLSLIQSSAQNEGLSGGKYKDHRLQADLGTVLAALSDLLEYVGVHESIRDTVASSDEIRISYFRSGLVIEIQYRDKDKDLWKFSYDYISADYSVAWLDP